MRALLVEIRIVHGTCHGPGETYQSCMRPWCNLAADRAGLACRPAAGCAMQCMTISSHVCCFVAVLWRR